MKYIKKIVLPAILLALSFNVNASLIGDTVTRQHLFPDLTTLHDTQSSQVVTADSSDLMCYSFSGTQCGLYSVDVGASTIEIDKIYNSWTISDFNGIFIDSLNDSSGNSLAGVTVDTNLVGWTSSLLSFDSDSIWINFINAGSNIGAGFLNLSLDFGDTKPSVVPVPAAAWLFGSALLGFFGFSRRKANAA